MTQLPRPGTDGPQVLDDAAVERVLVVMAHPDDVDFGLAGTVDLWTSLGIEVTYCVLTDGQTGGFDPDKDRSEMPLIRRHEQCAAAACVGVDDVRFLGYMDGELAVSRDLIRDLVRVTRQVRPQRVVTTSPERDWTRLYVSHPDHLAAGEAVTQALYPGAGNGFAFPELLEDEGLESWSAGELWLVGHPDSNHAVDVTDHLDAKLRALACHKSQHRDQDAIAVWSKAELSAWAAAHGLPEGRLAERFEVCRLLP